MKFKKILPAESSDAVYIPLELYIYFTKIYKKATSSCELQAKIVAMIFCTQKILGYYRLHYYLMAYLMQNEYITLMFLGIKKS